jgi:N-acetylmuramic acid 6-phosphate etherase
VLTEQPNPQTERIDQKDTMDILTIINNEDLQVALVVQAALPQIAEAVDAITAAFTRGGRLFYIGAGTSGRLGVLDAVECVPTFSIIPGQVQGLIAGGSAAMMRSIEGVEDQPEAGMEDLRAINLTSNDVVVGIAASGRTPYVLGALEYAQQVGAVTVGISCNVPAPVLDKAQIKIGLPVGPEVITGSTRMKAGTAEKLVLNMLSTTSMIKSGKVYGNLMVDVQITNEKLARRANRIVQEVTGVDENTASNLLRRSGDNAKVAIVMQRRDVDVDAARALLQAANGHLRKVIDE